MNAPLRTILIAGAAALAALGAVLSACQSYEADVVKPKAFKSVNQQIVIAGAFVKPKIMIVVDRSGSMMDSVSGTVGACAKNNLYNPSSTLDCKWKNLRDVFAGSGGFLPSARDMAFFGLTVFPGSDADSCSAGRTAVSISDSSDNVDAIMNQLLNVVTPAGGTPIATTLQNLVNDPQMAASSPNQMRFVMLLTDGMPNCNPANQSLCDTCKAAGCGTTSACTQCSSSPCNATFTVFSTTSCSAQNPCLDGDNTVASVKALKDNGISTYVIGFGDVTGSGSAASILNQAAIAGGLALDASAGTRFYQASSLDELRTALKNFADRYIPTCRWTLDPAPSSGQLVQVVKKDAEANTSTVLVREADYTLSGDVVQLTDALCGEVKSAPPDRYTYEFRYVSDL
jgi:hypothetical protein